MTDFTRTRRRDLSVVYAKSLRRRERRRIHFVALSAFGMMIAALAMTLQG